MSALAVIPVVAAVAGIGELVGWPRTRTVVAPRFVAAALIVIGWTASALFARQRLRSQDFQGVRVVEKNDDGL